MSKIIAFSNQKGGIGKTTANIMTANALSQEPFNYKCVVVDTDNQKSVVKIRLMDSDDFTGVFPYDVLNYNVATFEQNIQELDKSNDLIFVDVAGKLDTNLPVEHQEISRILNYVDFLFIPIVSGNFGLDSTMDYLKFVLHFQEKRAAEGRPFEIIAFQNMARERSRNYRFLKSELAKLKRMVNIKFMQSSLKYYTLFSDIDTYSNYYDSNATDKAKLNFSVWLNELHQIINNNA